MFNDAFYNKTIEKKDDLNDLIDAKNLNYINFKVLENKLLSIFDKIHNLQDKYKVLSIPKITPNYELREEQFLNNTGSKIEQNAIAKENIENELQYYIKAFTQLFDTSFCYYERTLFIDFYIKKLSRDAIIADLNIYKDKFYEIKYSLLVKIGQAFGWIEIN